jgi:hypothetical protein
MVLSPPERGRERGPATRSGDTQADPSGDGDRNGYDGGNRERGTTRADQGTPCAAPAREAGGQRVGFGFVLAPREPGCCR